MQETCLGTTFFWDSQFVRDFAFNVTLATMSDSRIDLGHIYYEIKDVMKHYSYLFLQNVKSSMSMSKVVVHPNCAFMFMRRNVRIYQCLFYIYVKSVCIIYILGPLTITSIAMCAIDPLGMKDCD